MCVRISRKRHFINYLIYQNFLTEKQALLPMATNQRAAYISKMAVEWWKLSSDWLLRATPPVDSFDKFPSPNVYTQNGCHVSVPGVTTTFCKM